MKQIFYLTILIIIIPFFIVMINLSDIKKEENNVKEPKSEVFVRLKRESTGVIENIPLEEYIVGVVAGEMPITFHIEALKAQAVAARSYVLKRLEVSKNNTFDVVDSTTNQVYLDNAYLKKRWYSNYKENMSKLEKAVSETSLQYLTYNGEIADALFFSTSNGFTENSEEIFSSEIPYLRSVESIWDEGTSPVFNDKKSYTNEEFYTLLGLKQSNTLDVKVTKTSSTGRTLKLTINGIEMTGNDVRDKLKLRSTDFDIKKDGNNITIKTSGYGHGVGMSQYGALGMANNGYKYDEILLHYYKGVTIKKLKS